MQLLVAAALLLPTANALVHPRATQPFSTWMAESIMARNEGHGLSSAGTPVVSYEHGEFQHALRALFRVTGKTKYLDYVKEGIDELVLSDGQLTPNYNQSLHSLDHLRVGPSFIKLWQQTRDKRYQTATQIFREHINGQPRNTKGGFWHRGGGVYPYQMWLDGLYMAEPFYTLLARDIEFGNTTAYKDIELQFKLIYDNTFDPETKLLKHGYFDLNAPAEVVRPVWVDPTTGQCPHVWNRAVGWYVMALADLLTGPDAIPPWTSAYWTLLKQYQQLIPALVENADPATGAWWLILTAVGQPGNYLESSGTAMFVYGMLRGITSGLIPDPKKTIRKAAIRAYEWLGNEMVLENADGTLSWNGTVNVGSLGSNGTFEYYISRPIALNDLKGSAAFVLASLEYEKL